MNTANPAPNDMDEYIAGFPESIQAMLQAIRQMIKDTVPDAQETISYRIPTFTLNGHYLLYVAAYKKHIGLYPVALGHEELSADLSRYASGKGTVKFPLDQPIPFDLIRKIVLVRARETLQRPAKKQQQSS